MGDKGMDQANLLLDLHQMPDLSLEAGQSCLVNAVLGNQEFILKSQRQLCQIDISIQAEIQGLGIRIQHGVKTNDKPQLPEAASAEAV